MYMNSLQISGSVDSAIAPNASNSDRTNSFEYVAPESWIDTDHELDEAWHVYA